MSARFEFVSAKAFVVAKTRMPQKKGMRQEPHNFFPMGD